MKAKRNEDARAHSHVRTGSIKSLRSMCFIIAICSIWFAIMTVRILYSDDKGFGEDFQLSLSELLIGRSDIPVTYDKLATLSFIAA